MTDLKQLMQMGQQLQQRMSKMQEDLQHQTVTATAGGGMVTATADGKGDLKEIKLDPTCVDPRDVEMLEDLILAAVTQAQQKSRELMESEMKKAAGGLPMGGLPGLFG